MDWALALLQALKGGAASAGNATATAAVDSSVTVNPEIYTLNVIDTEAVAEAIEAAGNKEITLLNSIKVDVAELLKLAAAAALFVVVIARHWR